MGLGHFLLAVGGVAVPAAALIATGCGSSVSVDPGRDGGGGEGGTFVFLDGGKDAPPDAPDGSHDAFPDYEDPGCPDQPPPLYDFQCDPYDQFNGDCAPGEGCFIFVQYPTEPCGQEIYGAYCYLAGGGTQGDSCGGGQDCAAGFVCVVSGEGNQCIQLCQLSGPDGCPPGLVCEPIDVEGFGGCI
ncbi:MAG: hypothetical protein JRI23_03630 [Deltaproteobacteria bacterium]|jgi:hypothetical protein|nr:hypothetical protein [Deltaproteobacteria bacterium]MBW2530607.1 hypothetical protein [Deltaproteobacteria bacterium]